jgi:hypothetical protein
MGRCTRYNSMWWSSHSLAVYQRRFHWFPLSIKLSSLVSIFSNPVYLVLTIETSTHIPYSRLTNPFLFQDGINPLKVSNLILITRNKCALNEEYCPSSALLESDPYHEKNIKVSKNGLDIFTSLQENPIIWKKCFRLKIRNSLPLIVIYQQVSTHT